MPPELDLFGYDIYRGWWIGGSPKEELEETQKIYAKLFAKLQPHQRAVVVGQGFACSNTSAYPLEQQDEVVAEKLELAFEWAKAEPRIAAINPWHWGTRHRAQHSGVCDMRLGMEVLPKAIEKLREIRKFMGPLHY